MAKVTFFEARRDGRPEAFDIVKGARTNCDACLLERSMPSAVYCYGEVMVLHALYSPWNDGIHHHLCMKHLRQFVPDVVIGDPNHDFAARNLDGEHVDAD